MDKNTLERVSAWAKGRLETGTEPPWTYGHLEALAKAAEEIAIGMPASSPSQMACAPQAPGRAQDEPQQGATIVTQDVFQSRRAGEHPVRLPT